MGEINAAIERIDNASMLQLRDQWQRLHPLSTLPESLSRDLLVRGIAWQIQAKAGGGLTASLSRQLDRLAGQLARSGDLAMEREVALKPGTRLVREWRGRTCRVLALEEGFLYEDRHYASLSQVARTITGTHWSGPRFFGLTQRSRQRTTADD